VGIVAVVPRFVNVIRLAKFFRLPSGGGVLGRKKSRWLPRGVPNRFYPPTGNGTEGADAAAGSAAGWVAGRGGHFLILDN
jgi:hypothetical protein